VGTERSGRGIDGKEKDEEKQNEAKEEEREEKEEDGGGGEEEEKDRSKYLRFPDLPLPISHPPRFLDVFPFLSKCHSLQARRWRRRWKRRRTIRRRRRRRRRRRKRRRIMKCLHCTPLPICCSISPPYPDFVC